MTGKIPGWLGLTPVWTTALRAPHWMQRQNGVPSFAWWKVSMVTRLRQFWQMNCCAVGTGVILPSP